MKISFGQVYVEVGANFPFSHHFQRLLSETFSQLATPTEAFTKRFGADFELMVRISARRNLSENEIKGPTVFKRDKDVEYTLFLPYSVIVASPPVCQTAVRFVLAGAAGVMDLAGITISDPERRLEGISEIACSNPIMTKGEWPCS